jgi:signal peptidase II
MRCNRRHDSGKSAQRPLELDCDRTSVAMMDISAHCGRHVHWLDSERAATQDESTNLDMTENIPASGLPSPVQEQPAPPRFLTWKRWFVPSAVGVLVADQLSKIYLFSLPPDVTLPSWIELTHNPGVAWGLGGGFPSVVALSSLVLIPLLTWFYWRNFRFTGAPENIAFGCILGGAVGNAWDRLLSLFGAAEGVRDFILVDLNLIGIDYRWPNFNIADAGICVGFVLLIIVSLFRPSSAQSPT